MSRKQRAFGLAIAILATTAPTAMADFDSLQQVQRYHAGMGEKSEPKGCEERFRSFAARQMSQSERQHERDACLSRARAMNVDSLAATGSVTPRSSDLAPVGR